MGARDLSCTSTGASAVGLPEGGALLGDLILYLGNTWHAGLGNRAELAKLVVDVSFARGSPRHQHKVKDAPRRESGYLQSMWEGSRLAADWNEYRRDRWTALTE